MASSEHQRYTAVPTQNGGYGEDSMRAPESDPNPFSTPNAGLTSNGSNSSYFPSSDRERPLPSPPLSSTAPRNPSPLSPNAGSTLMPTSMPMSMSSTSIPGSRNSGAGYRGSQAYQNIPSEQYWNEPAPQAMRSTSYGRLPPSDSDYPIAGTGAGGGGGFASAANRNGAEGGSKRKWWITGGILALLAIGGIVAGVVVSQVHKGSGSKGTSSSDATSGTGTGSGSSGNGTVSLGSDPSVFTKDDRLHQSFWAFAYTPQGAQPPWCSVSLANVTRDIQILSQLTTRLRLYGANCNATAMVMQAIKDTKVNMTIWPAIYIDSDDAAYKSQVTAVENALKTYGTDMVEGIIVGNEYILNAAGSSTNTSSSYLSSVTKLLSKVTDVRTQSKTWGLSKTLPVGTSDAGSILSTTLATGIDFFMANVHPYFGNQGVDTAAGWTSWFFDTFDVAVANTAPNKPPCFIAETGWPTQSNDTADANSGSGTVLGDASVANLQNTFVCQANTNGTNYFYFEAFDEPWKLQYGGVEPYWGLFDSDRNLKNVTVPNCVLS